MALKCIYNNRLQFDFLTANPKQIAVDMREISDFRVPRAL